MCIRDSSGLTQFADPTTLQSAAPYLAAWATFGRTGPTPICERITPVHAAPGGPARSVQVQRSPATETPFGRTSAYAAPTRSAGTTPTRSGSAPRPSPVDDAGSATASRNRVTVARTHPGHQRWTVPGGSFRGVATDVRCHRHRGTARRHRAAGADLPRPVLPRAVLRDAVALASRAGVK